MRLQLNLNQYYDGLDISQVNYIFSKFIYLKVEIDEIKKLINRPEERRTSIWELGLKVCSRNIQEGVNEINAYMESIGKEKIFDVGENIEDTDFEAIISKYEYLMSAPEKEEKTAEEPNGHEER